MRGIDWPIVTPPHPDAVDHFVTWPDVEAITRYRQTVKKTLNLLMPEYEKFTPGLGGRLKRRTLRLARALERSRRNTSGMNRRKYRH